MTDYTKLVAAVRDTDFGDTCVYCEHSDMCKDADCIILQAADAIEALQAEVKRLEPKRGEWIEVDKIKTYCSNCNWASYSMLVQKDEFLLRNNKTKFCPNCGAKMEVQE